MLADVVNAGIRWSVLRPFGEGFESIDRAFSNDLDGVIWPVAGIPGEGKFPSVSGRGGAEIDALDATENNQSETSAVLA